jgi:hypothetical protein
LFAVVAMTTEDLPTNAQSQQPMMNKWASRIIRTRSHRPRDSDTEDEDTPGVVDYDGGGAAGKQGAEIEEEGDIEESSVLSGDDSPATGDSHDNLQPHVGNESEAVGVDDYHKAEQEESLSNSDDDQQEEEVMMKDTMIVAVGEFVAEEEEPHQEEEVDVTGEGEHKPSSTKKRKVKKRLVGSHSTSIKQMKDAVVRAQAMIAASKVSTIQTMTTYATVMQAQNNPRSDTVLLHYDEIVERPDKKSEGERARLLPKWTMLLPQGANEKQMGAELEKLGKAMQEEKKRGGNKKSKAKAAEKREFEYDVVHTYEKYLESIYGGPVAVPIGSKKAKKTTTTV